jgi:hypothetical protein
VERALRLAGAASTHQVTAGAGLGSILNVEEGRTWNELIATDEQRLAWGQGQALTLQEAVAYALAPSTAVEASE